MKNSAEVQLRNKKNRKWNVLLSVFSSRRDGRNNYGSITADFYNPKDSMSHISLNPLFHWG